MERLHVKENHNISYLYDIVIAFLEWPCSTCGVKLKTAEELAKHSNCHKAAAVVSVVTTLDAKHRLAKLWILEITCIKKCLITQGVRTYY